MADRNSSVCRSVDWNCGGADVDGGVAGEGDRTIWKETNLPVPAEASLVFGVHSEGIVTYGQEESIGLVGGRSC